MKKTNELFDNIFELSDKINKADCLSAKISNDFFELESESEMEKNYIIYTFPQMRILFDILIDYIVNVKTELNRLIEEKVD